MTTPSAPEEGRCARCGRTGPVFPPQKSWGRVPGPLCARDWEKYDTARADQTYVDWNDAFDNASDEELEKGFRGEA